ncbi:retinol dehydrogenase 13-like isoform X2 [Coccinella septempunctata]|nr:retinol dehydrogenase 13-like isoform X2 [Coccinella septempunctata]
MIQKIKNFFSHVLDVSINCYTLFIHHIIWFRMNVKNGISNSLMCLNGKTAIVTGGNSGIGYMTTMLLASRGCRIIIACRRNAEKEINEIKKATNNPNITFKHLDLSRFASVRQFAENIKKEETKLDILINNAGLGYSDDVLTEDGLDTVMQTNFLGHFLLTHLLMDLLKASDGGRIVFLSSGIAHEHNMSVKNLYPTIPPTVKSRICNYTNSKGCNILVAQEMAKKVARYGIKVNAADPGVVVTPIFDILKEPGAHKTALRRLTNLSNFLLATDLIRAANNPFHVAISEEIVSGVHYFRCLPFPKLRGLNDKQFCEEIWRESEKIVQLRPEERL